eukprot:s1243_g7.t1
MRYCSDTADYEGLVYSRPTPAEAALLKLLVASFSRKAVKLKMPGICFADPLETAGKLARTNYGLCPEIFANPECCERANRPMY